MNGSKNALIVATLIVSAAGVAKATPHVPDPEPTYRPLRPDYVKTWYIFNDAGTRAADGVLRPGDKRVATFQNWWTPVSGHTQHNYDRDAYGPEYDPAGDIPSGPMNFATATLPEGDPSKNDAAHNYWLPVNDRPKALHFYMSYSQFDNNDFATYYSPGGQGYKDVEDSSDLETLLRDRNAERNGWLLGWVNGAIDKANASADPAGHVEMAVYVHNGKGLDDSGVSDVPGWGVSRSNPQVAMSNDIDPSAAYGGTGTAQWHPPLFNDDPGVMDYDAALAANLAYMNTLDNPPATFATIANSMEILERDPMNMPGLAWLLDTPDAILANPALNDPEGAPYRYDDAFTDLSTYSEGSTDGGVIAGLAGEDDFDPEDPYGTWHEQQVIRIDISPETLLAGAGGENGNVDEIVFYDFGEAPGSDQLTPREIVFQIDLNRTVEDGQIYFEDPDSGARTYFPDNRIYIARVAEVPEPATLGLLALGGGMLAVRKKRRGAR